MRRTLGFAVVFAALLFAACGDTPGDNDTPEDAARYVRDFVTACEPHEGVATAQTTAYYSAPTFVICNDGTGFTYDDQEIVQVDMQRSVKP